MVIFSALKRRWTEARDTYERQYGRNVNKSNFLSVYATAREKAFTSGNIIAAFRKTGIVPFNPGMITEDMTAPSRTSSSQSILPLAQQSPIRIMADMIHRQLARELVEEKEVNGEDRHINEGEGSHGNSPIRVAIQELQSTSGRHLVTKTPPRSTHKIPKFTPYTISPLKMRRYSDFIDDVPLTQRETTLLKEWQNAEQRDDRRKQAMIEMQGTVILQNMYCQTVQNHLYGREQKEKAKKKGVLVDGMPKLLDHDSFYAAVENYEEEAKRKASEKEERARLRQQHGEALANWKKDDDARKKRNEQHRAAHQEAVKVWERERESARTRGITFGRPKPKQGALEKGLPRPKKVTVNDEEENGSGSEDEVHHEDR